jgi:hypothetical protein
VMAQDAQDDNGGYGRWRRRRAVVQDGVVVAVQDGAVAAQDGAVAAARGSGARRCGGDSAERRGGGSAGQWRKMAWWRQEVMRRRTATRGEAAAARGRRTGKEKN